MLLFFPQGDEVAESVVLQVDGLRFAYPECKVLDGLSLAWPAGVALVQGDESSGKTSLLRLLAGELAAQAGEISLQGVRLRAQPEAYRALVFWQDPRSTSLDELTARQWLASLPACHARWDAAALAAHVQGFSLEPHLDKPFYALSTGSRRKVLMAGGLASGAALTLFDEPVAGLDRPSINYLTQALAEAAHHTARLVVVAHYEVLPGIAWRGQVTLGRADEAPAA
ncbi:MAG TPA: ATP-binding cassette domain-containing protein [Acidovorax sp.]|jgi:ABC-type transport system involved in cytochrome c biogenesis ATPase subunit|nr:ATP-binding cassette domain-containing protein [Acidovorax sp.]